MNAPITAVASHYLDTDSEYQRITLQATAQDSQSPEEYLLQELRKAYQIIGNQQTANYLVGEQLKAANDRAIIGTTTEEHIPQSSGIASLEISKFRSKVKVPTVLNANNSSTGCGNGCHGISDQILTEILQFASSAPAFESYLSQLVSPTGRYGCQQCSGSKTSSGGDWDIDFQEFLRLFDGTIDIAYHLQDRIHTLETIIQDAAPASISPGRADVITQLNAEINRLNRELEVVSPENSRHDVDDRQKPSLHHAITTTNDHIADLDIELAWSNARVANLEARLEASLANHGAGPSTNDAFIARLKDQIGVLVAQIESQADQLEAAENRIWELEAEQQLADEGENEHNLDSDESIEELKENPAGVRKHGHKTASEITRLHQKIERLEADDAIAKEREKSRLRTLLDYCTVEKKALSQSIESNPANLGPQDIVELRTRADKATVLETEVIEAGKSIEALQASIKGDRVGADQAELDELIWQVEILTLERDAAEEALAQHLNDVGDQDEEHELEVARLQELLDESYDLNEENLQATTAREQSQQKLLNECNKAHKKPKPGARPANNTPLIRKLRKEIDALKEQLANIPTSSRHTALVSIAEKDVSGALIDSKVKISFLDTEVMEARAEIERLGRVLEQSWATIDRIRAEREALKIQGGAPRRAQKVNDVDCAQNGTLRRTVADLQEKLTSAQDLLATSRQMTRDADALFKKRVDDYNEELEDKDAQIQQLQADSADQIQQWKDWTVEAAAWSDEVKRLESVAGNLKAALQGSEELLSAPRKEDEFEIETQLYGSILADNSQELIEHVEDSDSKITELNQTHAELQNESRQYLTQFTTKVTELGVNHVKLGAEVKKLLETAEKLQEQLKALGDSIHTMTPAEVKGFKTSFHVLIYHTQQLQQRLESLITGAEPGVDDDADLKTVIDILTEQHGILRREGQPFMDSVNQEEHDQVIVGLELQLETLSDALQLNQNALSNSYPPKTGNGLFTSQKNKYIIQIETWQQWIKELQDEIAKLRQQNHDLTEQNQDLTRHIMDLEEEIEDVQRLVEVLQDENAHLTAELNNVKIELFDKISGAVDHLRKEEIAKAAMETAMAAEADTFFNDATYHEDLGAPARSNSREPSLEIITEYTPEATKLLAREEEARQLASFKEEFNRANIPSTPKPAAKSKTPAKRKGKIGKTSHEVPKQSAEPEKPVTRSSKRKAASSQEAAKQTKPVDKRRKRN